MDVEYEFLVNTFKIKSLDKTIRLLNYKPHRFSHPPSMSKPECFTVIAIDAFSDRSKKHHLHIDIVDKLDQFGISAAHILILLRKSVRKNWGK